MTLPAIRIIGIDPELRNTGWGIIDCQGSRLSFVACGRIHPTPELEMGERLRQLNMGLLDVIAQYSPSEAAIEETFVNRDPQSALKLGQARGVALMAPATARLVIAEYAANLVKKTVVGSGHADKNQIQMMVRVLLPASNPTSPDAADALAVAICHAQHRNIRTRVSA